MGDRLRHLVFLTLDIPPAWLGINGQEKAVLCALVNRLNAKRNGSECWPSIATLAERTGFSESSVRRSLRKLQAVELVKLRSDSGKSNVYSVNVDALRTAGARFDPATAAAADPCHSDRGSERDPCQPDRGTPVSVTPHPCQPDTRMTKEGQREVGEQSSYQHFAIPKVSHGDHQRKLAVHGLVSQTADAKRSPSQERQTEEHELWKNRQRTAGE